MPINNLQVQPRTPILLPTPKERRYSQHPQLYPILRDHHLLMTAAETLEEVSDGAVGGREVLAVQAAV